MQRDDYCNWCPSVTFALTLEAFDWSMPGFRISFKISGTPPDLQGRSGMSTGATECADCI